MLIAVDFDNQLRFEAAEVRHIGADRDLTTEVRAVDRHAMAQVQPQFLFGLCLPTTQNASSQTSSADGRTAIRPATTVPRAMPSAARPAAASANQVIGPCSRAWVIRRDSTSYGANPG